MRPGSNEFLWTTIKARMKTKATTLFDILGVSGDVDTDGVKNRFQEHWVAAGCDYGAMPREIMYAVGVLEDEQGRSVYKDILRACYGGFPLKVDAREQGYLREICEIAQIRVFELPRRPGTFEFRTVNQEAPYWSQEVPGFPRAPEPALRRVIRGAWRFVTLQLFLDTSVKEKLGLVLLYGVVGCGAYFAVPTAKEAVVEYRAAVRVDSARERHADAVQELAALRKAVLAFAADFEDITQVELGDNNLTTDLNRAMIKHPTVHEAWNAIDDNRVSEANLEVLDKKLSAISIRDESEASLGAHLARISEILVSIDQYRRSLETQRADLAHIEHKLNLDRRKRQRKQEERKTP
jgi:hypothetical protein